MDELEDIGVVNVLDFYRAHGISENAALQITIHLILTRSYAIEADARAAALELGYDIPFVFPTNGQLH